MSEPTDRSFYGNPDEDLRQIVGTMINAFPTNYRKGLFSKRTLTKSLLCNDCKWFSPTLSCRYVCRRGHVQDGNEGVTLSHNLHTRAHRRIEHFKAHHSTQCIHINIIMYT